MRIFRILKLVRFLQDSNLLVRTLAMSQRKILIFFSAVAILVTIFGALMYVIEGPENGFTSIPRGIYWAIITITTVGYGDVVPKTPLGQAVAALTMLLGYSILAVPTGIITAELNQEIKLTALSYYVQTVLKVAMKLTLYFANIVEVSWPSPINASCQ